MRKRKTWRKRAVAALMEIVTFPAGAPGREAVKAEAIKAQEKLAQWYRPSRADQVLSSIRKRAVEVFKAL